MRVGSIPQADLAAIAIGQGRIWEPGLPVPAFSSAHQGRASSTSIACPSRPGSATVR